jgi:hypothetical protein
MHSNPRTILVTLATIAGLAGCAADSTGPGAAGRQSMTVSFMTAASSGVAASRSLSDTVGTNVLVISKVELVLARLELERVGATCASDSTAGDDDHRGDDSNCAELELMPSVVSLPVNGGVATALNVTIPAGTYSALEAKIRAVKSNQGHNGAGTAAFLAAHPDLAGVSVRVEGTYNGKAFTYTAAPRAELEIKFNPDLVVAGTAANITVNIDIARWFKTSSGALIDPATALDGKSNANLVAANIRASIRAFHDDDRDGHDDHGEHGDGHT